ncbi:hypothetical protein D3C81_613590 [compost metagenome]
MNNDNKSLGETLLVIEHTRLHQNSMEFSGGSGGAGGCGGSGGCGGAADAVVVLAGEIQQPTKWRKS